MSAAQLKERGTAQFRANDHAAALDSYTAAAALIAATADRFGELSFADESMLATLHANRAACALKLGDGEAALRYWPARIRGCALF
jgi:hypothetical protein